ncbi:MAG: hypothetical protein QF489_03255 [Planctomycetota bacterium]|nr:hypothetical protein [Planctomycetota bacterium]
MTTERPTIKHRALEGVLWGAVILVGGYLLLPAAVDLVQTSQQEEKEAAEAAKLEEELNRQQDRIDAFSKDPEAARKIAEQRDLEGRRKQNDQRSE